MHKTVLLFTIAATLGLGVSVHADDLIYERSIGYQLKKPLPPYDSRPVVQTAGPAAGGFVTPYGVTPVVHGVPQPLLRHAVAHRLQVTTHFAFDRAQLPPGGEGRIDALLDSVGELDPGYGMGRYGYVVGGSVVGHTDSIGSTSYNQALSQRRAAAAADYLQSRGADTNTMNIYGAGENQPVADNSTEAGRAQNRRTEINVDLLTTPDY